MASYLVVGGDGVIGSALVVALKAASNGVWHTTRRVSGASGAIRVDLREIDALSLGALEPVLSAGPLVAFLAAAVTGFQACESNPGDTRKVNVETTAVIAERIVAGGGFVVFLSSTAVFRGDSAPPGESQSPDPVTEYGRQKADVEARILNLPGTDAATAQVAVVRMTKVLGPGRTLVGDWVRALRKSACIDAATDLFVAPISLRYALHGLVRAAQARVPGVFHLSGAEIVSYYELACRIASGLGLPTALVRPTQVREHLGQIPFPRFPSLDMKLTSARLGILPQAVDDTVADLLEAMAGTGGV